MSNRNDLALRVRNKALELGYDFCGITGASPFEEFLENIEKRSRYFPESKSLYDRIRKYSDPKESAQWAKSIVVSIFRYGKYRIPSGIDHLVGKYYLADGRLSYAPEFSIAAQFEAWLHGLGFRTRRDGIPFRWAAAKAGIGQFGKNNFIYTRHGSWVRIDAWTVDQEMDHDRPSEGTLCPEHCTTCIDACPTGALSGPFRMNYGACIAHLNHGVHTLPSFELNEKIGSWIYGCDVCQNVCPLNHGTWKGGEEFPQLNEFSKVIDLERLYRMDDEAYMNVVYPRLWYIERERIWLWRCNLLRAMGNSGNKDYLGSVRAACEDPDERIRAMARWALERMNAQQNS